MRPALGVAALAAAALLNISAFNLAYGEETSPPEDKSGSMAHMPASYDYTLSNGSKQFRLKMESVGNEKVYSSFVDGVLIANARVPIAAQPSGTTADANSFNQYVKASSDALAEAGLDPKALGLTYVSAQIGSGADDDKTIRVPAEAAKKPRTEHARMGVSSELTP